MEQVLPRLVSDGDVEASSREYSQLLHVHAYQLKPAFQRGEAYLSNVQRNTHLDQILQLLRVRQMQRAQESPQWCEPLLILDHHHQRRP